MYKRQHLLENNSFATDEDKDVIGEDEDLPASSDLDVSIDKSVNNTNDLVVGFNQQYPQDSQNICGICGRQFNSRTTYARHMLEHRRGHAFVCHNCGLAFTRNYLLRSHLEVRCVVNEAGDAILAKTNSEAG